MATSSSPEELLQRLGETPPDTYPLEIVTEMISRLDEMVPALLRELELADEDDEFHNKGNHWLRLFFATYLLAQARETRAYGPLVNLLALTEREASDLWGDMITGCMGRILASVFDGDDAHLRGLIENPDISEYVRGAAVVGCYEALCNAGLIGRDKVETYFRELLDSRLEREPSLVWDGLCTVCGDLGFEGLLPSIKKAFEEGLCDTGYNTYEDIAREAASATPKYGTIRSHSVSLITDTIAETKWWACFQPKAAPDPRAERFANALTTQLANRSRREGPKIGRNEPCPCGSGKKYKKCCG